MLSPPIISLALLLFVSNKSISQNYVEQYNKFKKNVWQTHLSFRGECNQKYAEFLRSAWDWYEGNAPLPLPQEANPIPPRPYQPIEQPPISIEPTPIKPIDPTPQPKPISPIKENPNPEEDSFPVSFYGIECNVRIPQNLQMILSDCNPDSLGDVWELLCTEELNNTIRDCLETRIRYNLCDWAYLQFLIEFGRQYCTHSNGATFLTAFLYCQSGYQMRLSEDNGTIVMLIGSKHHIYDLPYYVIDGELFYSISETSDRIRICNAEFESETPMSLCINAEQILGTTLSESRKIISTDDFTLSAKAEVPIELIKFYNTYPTSVIDNNPLTRWALYANTPLSDKTNAILYPSLKEAIGNCSKLNAANKLLNWVQIGFVYEYDDNVWGHDRAFFAEETLYYPYADCEDRSILFSRLVRDLLGLDVALIYYPGHLATAVKFDTEVPGDAVLINGERYIVCDPTYIGAPVGAQMPDLEYDKTEAIILNR